MTHETPRSDRPISLVGAGLSGSLLAVYLANRGMRVNVFEYRDDMRQAEVAGGRSINLALSTRGLNALAGVGMAERTREMCIPMHGRLIHDLEGNTELQPYGREGQYINSISRSGLNQMLLEEADQHDHIELHFNQKCVGVDLEQPGVHFEDLDSGEEWTDESRLVIGADGAFSNVRARLQVTDRFDYQQSFLEHGYKELEIPPAPDGSHRIETNALHIWPRHDFMMIALPNLDGSFTVTLFLAFEGEDSFEQLNDEQEVIAFFEKYFPDAIEHMPNLVEDFFDNPTASLVTIRCEPYHHQDKVLLVGDAAHAVVPFYGQGMNAAFEDCFELDQLLERYDEDWTQVLPAFSEERKPNADAIADLALYNYVEMRSKVADETFLLRKALDRKLHELHPETWIPLYSMVTFSNIPYAEARERADRQSDILDKLLPEGPMQELLEKLGEP
jgi:kynurenine 3-monooxygenase